MNNPKYYIGSFRFGYWTVGTGKCPCNTNKIVFGSVVDNKGNTPIIPANR